MSFPPLNDFNAAVSLSLRDFNVTMTTLVGKILRTGNSCTFLKHVSYLNYVKYKKSSSIDYTSVSSLLSITIISLFRFHKILQHFLVFQNVLLLAEELFLSGSAVFSAGG